MMMKRAATNPPTSDLTAVAAAATGAAAAVNCASVFWVGMGGVSIEFNFAKNSSFVSALNGLGRMCFPLAFKAASVFSEGTFALRAFFIIT